MRGVGMNDQQSRYRAENFELLVRSTFEECSSFPPIFNEYIQRLNAIISALFDNKTQPDWYACEPHYVFNCAVTYFLRYVKSVDLTRVSLYERIEQIISVCFILAVKYCSESKFDWRVCARSFRLQPSDL